MTGTGTQNDPYIVDAWSDFVTAIGTSGVYVKVADDTVWDMNSIAPEGIDRINCTCAELDGNGAVIKNAYIPDYYVLSLSNTVKNLQIENFLLRYGSTGASVINSSPASIVSNCVFTGVLEATSAYVIKRANKNAIVQKCAFNVSFRLATGKISWDYTNSADNNQFNHAILDITNTLGIASGNYPAYCNFQNSLIEVTRKSQHTDNFETSYTKNSIIRYNENQESELNHVISSGGRAYEVTSAQLQDAAYLASIDFPIGVD